MLFRLAVFLLFSVFSTFAQTSAIRAGHLIDPATGQVADNQVILVKDGTIAEVGPNVRIPAGAEVLDLSHSWVLPGLMDAHTHLTLRTSRTSAYLEESTAFRVLRGIYNARVLLEAGFTAVKDIGNDGNYGAVDMRRAIARGWFPGPTMLTAGKIIAPFGGQSHGIPPEQGPFWQYEYIDADTPDEVRKAVRQDIYYGANTIKLVADNSAFYYSQEEIHAAAEEAHNAGLTVAVHVFGGPAARNVILGGADSIEHGFDLSDELLQLMKEKGCLLVGTDFPEEHLKIMGIDNWTVNGKRLSERIIDRLRRAHRIGTKMAFGTDIVIEPRDRDRAQLTLDYLDVWLAAGIPPADILKAMTTNAAELFHWQGTRGAIAAGEAADIIATPEDPLADIHALRKVHFVMKDGKVIKRPAK